MGESRRIMMDEMETRNWSFSPRNAPRKLPRPVVVAERSGSWGTPGGRELPLARRHKVAVSKL